MADVLARLNIATREEAAALLGQCCAARPWIEVLVERRPYADADALLEAADRTWRELGPRAWRDAFRGHPRIGETKAAASPGTTAAQWSAQEQSVAAHSDDEAQRQLREAQRAYEERFGHIFLICATGLSAAQMLESLRARMHNDPDTELRVAAEEQRRITQLRLEKLLAT